MERRSEPRFPASHPVTVTTLDHPADKVVAGGHLANVSGQGMCVVVDRPLPPGSLVRIDLPGELYLGEAVYCEPQEGGRYAVGIRLEHRIADPQRFAESLDH
ncbi:MAG: PilZ domain-containing protein [Bryobacteraceae bacterium]